jgi:hypothetical protein
MGSGIMPGVLQLTPVWLNRYCWPKPSMPLTPLDYDEIMTNLIIEMGLRRMNNEEQHTVE